MFIIEKGNLGKKANQKCDKAFSSKLRFFSFFLEKYVHCCAGRHENVLIFKGKDMHAKLEEEVPMSRQNLEHPNCKLAPEVTKYTVI